MSGQSIATPPDALPKDQPAGHAAHRKAAEVALLKARASLGRVMGFESWDALDVAGTANLDGTLNLSYLGDFTASRGDQFTLITANSINGVFSDVSFPDQQDWFITYSTDGNVNVGVAIPIPPAAGMIPALLAIAAYRRQRKPVLR